LAPETLATPLLKLIVVAVPKLVAVPVLERSAYRNSAKAAASAGSANRIFGASESRK